VSAFLPAGASGAVNAIVLLNALMFPTHTVYLYFFIPVRDGEKKPTKHSHNRKKSKEKSTLITL
jgi:hypothetical protein